MRWKTNDVSFEIPDEWWERARMLQFVPFGPAFETIQTPGEPVIVYPIVQIPPLKRDPNIEGFSECGFIEERMISILNAFCEKTPLPPVQVNEQSSGPYRYKLYDGFHRYYASIAAGFSHLPITVVQDLKAFFAAEERWRVRPKA